MIEQVGDSDNEKDIPKRSKSPDIESLTVNLRTPATNQVRKLHIIIN